MDNHFIISYNFFNGHVTLEIVSRTPPPVKIFGPFGEGGFLPKVKNQRGGFFRDKKTEGGSWQVKKTYFWPFFFSIFFFAGTADLYKFSGENHIFR